jgi:hypothetical protein
VKHYLLTLLLVSAVTSAAVYLSSGTRHEKYLRYLCALLTLLALLAPLPSLFSNFSEITLPSEEAVTLPSSAYGDLLKAETEKRLEEELSYHIERRFSLSKEDFSLDCHLSLDKNESLLSFEGISVKLYTLAAVTKREEMREELLTFCENVAFTEAIGQDRRS